MAASGIESLSPITVHVRDELIRTVKMTDALDPIYKRGGSSREFLDVAGPIETTVVKAQALLPKGDPRRDLLVNMFEAYQNTALAMVGKEAGNNKVTQESSDATFVVAGLRKAMLLKLVEGNMGEAEKNLYYEWRKSLSQ
jgi:hypothetical protein